MLMMIINKDEAHIRDRAGGDGFRRDWVHARNHIRWNMDMELRILGEPRKDGKDLAAVGTQKGMAEMSLWYPYEECGYILLFSLSHLGNEFLSPLLVSQLEQEPKIHSMARSCLKLPHCIWWYIRIHVFWNIFYNLLHFLCALRHGWYDDGECVAPGMEPPPTPCVRLELSRQCQCRTHWEIIHRRYSSKSSYTFVFL